MSVDVLESARDNEDRTERVGSAGLASGKTSEPPSGDQDSPAPSRLAHDKRAVPFLPEQESQKSKHFYPNSERTRAAVHRETRSGQQSPGSEVSCSDFCPPATAAKIPVLRPPSL